MAMDWCSSWLFGTGTPIWPGDLRAMHDFTRLEVWRRSLALAVDVARAIPASSAQVAPGLRNQAVRSAQRIPDTIAEGCGKRTDREFARFLDIATGSATELLSQLALAYRHGFISGSVFRRLWRECSSIRLMLSALQRAVRKRFEPPRDAPDLPDSAAPPELPAQAGLADAPAATHSDG